VRGGKAKGKTKAEAKGEVERAKAEAKAKGKGKEERVWSREKEMGLVIGEKNGIGHWEKMGLGNGHQSLVIR